jgi:hypothetical protein
MKVACSFRRSKTPDMIYEQATFIYMDSRT